MSKNDSDRETESLEKVKSLEEKYQKLRKLQYSNVTLLEEYKKEKTFLKSRIKDLKEEEILTRYKEDLNLRYKEEISSMEKRIEYINKDTESVNENLDEIENKIYEITPKLRELREQLGINPHLD